MTSPGEIQSGSAYTLRETKARLGWGTVALRRARERGLPVRRLGRRSYILGSDLIDHIRKEGRIVGDETVSITE